MILTMMANSTCWWRESIPTEFPIAISGATWATEHSPDSCRSAARLLRVRGVGGIFDNDGYLDILLTGITADGIAVAQVWRNLGNGTFADIDPVCRHFI